MRCFPLRLRVLECAVFTAFCVLWPLFMGGCSQPEDMVKVKVAPEVQKKTGAPPEVTLNQFQDVKAQYEDAVKAEAEKKAADAAAAARAITRATRTVQTKYADQIATLQRQAEAEIGSLADDAAENQQRADAALAALNAEFARTRERMNTLESQAQAKAEQIRSLVNFGLNEVAPALAGTVPGVGLALPIMAGLAGLFLRRPGDATKEAQAIKAAEDRGYDMGASDTRRNLREGVMVKALAEADTKVGGGAA
jgi:hypothetical protein